MDITGPSMCEANETTEYFLTAAKEGIIVELIDPNNCTKLITPIDTNDPLKKLIEVLPTTLGQHHITIYAEGKGQQVFKKDFFCFNLEIEPWHFDEVHGSLDEINIKTELSLNYQIADYINAHAYLLNETLNSKPIQCKVNRSSETILKFSFNPSQFGSYKIKLRCGELFIKSPWFLIHVLDFSKFKLIHSFITDSCLTSLEKKVSFIFDLCGAPSNYLKSWIEDPDKVKVDMLLYGEEKEEKIGQLRCDFIPLKIGSYSLLASYGGYMFQNCPLVFHVYDSDMVKIVKIIPPLTTSFMVSDILTISYDCSLCGPGTIEILPIVHHNSGTFSTVPVEIKSSSQKGLTTCKIKFKFQGKYIIDVLYNNEIAKNATLELLVNPQAASNSKTFPKVFEPSLKVTRHRKEEREKKVVLIHTNNVGATYTSVMIPTKEVSHGGFKDIPEVFGEGLMHAEVGKVAAFTVNPKEDSGQLTIDAKGPKSLTKCLIRPEPVSGFYNVEYYPNEVGMYMITILWNGQSIPGSPFHVPVTDLSKIRCLNFPQIFKKPLILTINKRVQVDFDYSKAGNGRFLVIMEKNNIETKLKCWINAVKKMWSFFIESEIEGRFHVNVLWNDVSIGIIEVQCKCLDTNSLNEESYTIDPVLQVVLRGRGMKEAWVDEEAEFLVDALNAGDGELNVKLYKVHDTVNTIPIVITHTTNAEYKCTYKATISGDYLLSIFWGKKTVKGSPFVVKVRNYEPSRRIKCIGDGLFCGLIGEDIFINIITESPLKSEESLEASCIGSDGDCVACEIFKESITQYQLKLNIPVEGKYQLNVLYEKSHILGSPFYPVYSDQEKLSKIIVDGPGLLSSSLDEAISYFTVDTRQVGFGKLTVQVKGPKESFHVEVQKDVEDERLIRCSYNPIMPGLYILTVRWNGILTRGSPFSVVLS